jgi:acyl-coenzyme A thioesterase PaaI-like protein
VEFKINFLQPAQTERLIVVGQVLQSGRTLTICEGTVFDETRTRAIARMTTTMMSVSVE